MSSAVVEMGAAEEGVVEVGVAKVGSSEADLFTEEVVECMDSERCLFRL